MEINITPLLTKEGFDPYYLSNSRANLGDNAGQITWKNSKDEAENSNLLDTEQKIEAWKKYIKSSGGWDDEEIESWNKNILEALFIQWIAGDIRDSFGDNLPNDFNKWDWETYNKDVERGTVSGNIYKGYDNNVYFSIDS